MSESCPAAVVERLRRYGQEHLVRWWGELQAGDRQQLLEQIENVDFEQIQRLLAARRSDEADGDPVAERALRAGPPAETVRLSQRDENPDAWRAATEKGREMLAAGQVGAILVAGGQGTRLGFPRPKGMYGIGPVSNCSLFQIFVEQLQARSKQAGASIPYCIMTSDATHEETIAYFEEHDFFGLKRDDVFFFQQGTMPAADAETGKLLLSEKGRLSSSPDWHGGMLAALVKGGLLDEMRSRGIEFLYYHQVDNPTVKLCDPALLGFHALRQSEMSTKVVAKRAPEEKMGVLVDVDGKTQIIEYSDLPEEVAQKTDEAGNLLLWAGSTAIHVFDRAFLQRLVDERLDLPFHLAHKAVPYIGEGGELVRPKAPNAIKFERFIFDALPHARRALVVEAERAREFNPVKNANGPDSPETARAAMTRIFRGWLREAGVEVSDGQPVEISPLFALDADDVRQKVAAGTRFDGPVQLR